MFHHVSTDEVYGSLGDDGLLRKKHLTTQEVHILPRRHLQIILSGHIITLMDYPLKFRIVLTITGSSFSRKINSINDSQHRKQKTITSLW